MDTGYTSFRKNNKKDNGRIRSYLVTEKFMLLLTTILSGGDVIHMRPLHNMEKFISNIDRNYYFKDPTLTALILTVESFVNMRIRMLGKPIDEASLITKINTLLISETYTEIKENLLIPTVENAKKEIGMDVYDIDFVNNSIEVALKVYKIIREKDRLIEISNEIDGGADDLVGAINEYREVVNRIQEYFKETDNDNNISEIVHTADETFYEKVRSAYENLINPKSVLKTGLQYFNKMLPGGGFVNGKYYIFYANTNTFKSALLMHIARWIRKYNSRSFEEDPEFKGKQPTILFISCENSEQEDIERIFKMSIGKDIGLLKSADEAEAMWKNDSDEIDSIIDISFYHTSSRTVSASDIDRIIDTLYDEGFKVITVIFDYIELMKSEEMFSRLDTRETLGRLSECLLNIAKSRMIPVITAMQLNRKGGEVLVETKASGETNAITKMNNAHIGESYNIEKSADFSFFIDLETNPHDNQRYLLILGNKFRGGEGEIKMFAHPIENGLVIRDDIFLPKPISVLSLSYDKDGEKANADKSGKVGSRGSIDGKRPGVNTETILRSKKSDEQEPFRWWAFSPLLDIGEVLKTSTALIDMNRVKNMSDDDYYFDQNDKGIKLL